MSRFHNASFVASREGLLVYTAGGTLTAIDLGAPPPTNPHATVWPTDAPIISEAFVRGAQMPTRRKIVAFETYLTFKEGDRLELLPDIARTYRDQGWDGIAVEGQIYLIA